MLFDEVFFPVYPDAAPGFQAGNRKESQGNGLGDGCLLCFFQVQFFLEPFDSPALFRFFLFPSFLKDGIQEDFSLATHIGGGDDLALAEQTHVRPGEFLAVLTIAVAGVFQTGFEIGRSFDEVGIDGLQDVSRENRGGVERFEKILEVLFPFLAMRGGFVPVLLAGQQVGPFMDEDESNA